MAEAGETAARSKGVSVSSSSRCTNSERLIRSAQCTAVRPPQVAAGPGLHAAPPPARTPAAQQRSLNRQQQRRCAPPAWSALVGVIEPLAELPSGNGMCSLKREQLQSREGKHWWGGVRAMGRSGAFSVPSTPPTL